MTEPEFKSFNEIKKFEGIHVIITRKYHGTNAQIIIDELGNATAASRSRLLTIDDDNYGFAAFVEENKMQLVSFLGAGRYYGEWTGPGVNSGEGLKEKTLFLFNTSLKKKFELEGKVLPNRVQFVDVLYDGPYTLDCVDEACKALLAKGGSPEGVVLYFPQFGSYKKKVFKPEETGWTKQKKEFTGPKINYFEIAKPYLQPMRLEKMLMKDERYLSSYPETVPDILRDYLDDLAKENPEPLTEEQLKAIKKSLYIFINNEIETNEQIRQLRNSF